MGSHRDGSSVGEGAGILVLEELEQATRRGAPTLAELVGYGMTSDAHPRDHAPENGEGVARVMTAALETPACGHIRFNISTRTHINASRRSRRNRGHRTRVRTARSALPSARRSR